MGLSFEEMYDMTLKELSDTVTQRKKWKAYEFWKNAYMNSWAMFGKDYPKEPEPASPELYPSKPRYKIPDFLKERLNRKGG